MIFFLLCVRFVFENRIGNSKSNSAYNVITEHFKVFESKATFQYNQSIQIGMSAEQQINSTNTINELLLTATMFVFVFVLGVLVFVFNI